MSSPPSSSSGASGAAREGPPGKGGGRRGEGRRPSQTGLLRITGATEGFHRSRVVASNNPYPASNADANANNGEGRAITSAPEMRTHERSKSPDAVQPLSLERASGGLPNITHSGLHMPPEVLGNPMDTSPAQDEPPKHQRRPSTIADVNQRARRKSNIAIKSANSQAAAAAAAEILEKQHLKAHQLDGSMFTMLTYRGMEVLFSTTHQDRLQLVGLCSRTRQIFQTLALPCKEPIVSITSNSHTGMLIVAHHDGTIQTYTPLPTCPGDPELDSNPSHPKAAFGRYRWVNGPLLRSQEIFYQSNETPNFADRRSAKPGPLLDISTSYDYKLLVAHQNQLAVFDVMPLHLVSDDPNIQPSSTEQAKLLWTTLLKANIVTAKISGDGQAIVVVMADQESDYTAATFIHDMEDGSNRTLMNPPTLERNISVGMVYKQGPYLPHSAPVTRISFRGMGHVTSNVSVQQEDQGNDLLLTYCAEDCSVRIFNQNSWQQLMLWTTPKNSRADWIRGSSAFSLGDLESQKKIKSTGSKPLSRKNSVVSLDAMSNGTGGINSALRGSGRPMPTHPPPSSSAGAWIAELTFRNAFPALRLSRLSYMKRGNADSQPAHFESVAAILPAGSIVAQSVLNSDDLGMCVQGIWPAWNPWLSESTDAAESSDTLSGSAMAFLGLSSVPPPTGAYFGDSYLGGTHSPPSELRMVASHPTSGRLVLMEFPLWGDEDFGAMELGSPLRYVMSLSDVEPLDTPKEKNKQGMSSLVTMDYSSSRLCAEIDPDARAISISWRKQGTMSFYSPSWIDEEVIPRSPALDVADPLIPELYHDVSMVPVPLVLPPIRMPRGTGNINNDTIVAIKWWPDDSFGGPPLLMALTESATMLLFEIPPPWCALEPSMPDFDPFTGGSTGGSIAEMYDGILPEMSGSEDNEDMEVRQEYDVMVTPHPDFGLGLRLESPMDGLPAVAGSFKMHPLNGGNLPAEKTGMIVLGDELLSVNGVTLENLTFDDIIATVRHVGADAGPGEALCLRFRPGTGNTRGRRNTAGSFALNETSSSPPSTLEPTAKASPESGSTNRRSMQEMLGVSPKAQKRKESNIHRRRNSDSGSLASLLVGSFGETQQEFGRMIAVIPKSVPRLKGKNVQERLLLVPWTSGSGSPSPSKFRGVALILVAVGSTLHAKRLELPLDSDPDKARVVDLGAVDVDQVDEKKQGDVKDGPVVIQSIQMVPIVGNSKCIAVCDNHGSVRLIFLTIEESSKPKSEIPPLVAPLVASFRHYDVFNLGDPRNLQLRTSSSVNYLATMQKNESQQYQSIKVWTARPDPIARMLLVDNAIKDPYFGQDYCWSEIRVDSSDPDFEILDFCFLETGYLDAFPTLVAFLKTEAIAYQRRGGCSSWKAIIRLTYPSIPDSTLTSSLTPSDQFATALSQQSPLNAFPHILPAIREALPSYDETNYVRSDWHPESLLAHLCTEENGTKLALRRHVRRVYLWLSKWRDSSDETLISANIPLVVPPSDAVGGDKLMEQDEEDETDTHIESAASLIASMSLSRKASTADQEKEQLQALQSALAKPRNFVGSATAKSLEFRLAMSSGLSIPDTEEGDQEALLPPILNSLQAEELRVLWAIGEIVLNPPNFRTLDAPGQLALTVHRLYTALKSSLKDDGQQKSGNPGSSMPSFLVKRQMLTMKDETPKLPPPNASAGCVAALLSSCQGQIIECLRRPGDKIDWETARGMRVPFWIRSDDTLRKISEEIGQKMYKDSRDILKSALFFIVAGKKRTLMNLAAADHTESGKKLYKFMSDFDFTSERGRRAAEKNAFSLLRKNRYASAAAFFLLAEPPALKSAVETIATKMQDLDLAFLVARLVESSTSNNTQLGGFGLGGTAMMGLGGGFGGGGGYAGMVAPIDVDAPKDKETFSEWKPILGKGAKDLLRDRGFPSAVEDSCLTAVQLLWLGRREEASQYLSGFLACTDGLLQSYELDVSLPRLGRKSNKKKTQDNVISTTNAIIDFAAGPFLLKTMHANIRTRFASCLLVSSSLSRVGIELPSIQTVLQNTDFYNLPGDSNNAETALVQESETKKDLKDDSRAQSSIFDDFNTAPTPQKKTASSGTGQMASSIFDDFDAPPPKKMELGTAQNPQTIFDSHDVAPTTMSQNAGPSTVSAGSQMTSSIFDDFDAAPQKKFAVPPSSSGHMASSIFDSFDAPPAPKPVAADQGGQMTSSIFDSFDAPPPPKPAAPASEQMSSSIFDGFDAAPQQKPVASASLSGQMSSSIFDSFDAPSVSAPKISIANPATSQGKKPSENPLNQAPVEEVEFPEVDETVAPRPIPMLWLEWRDSILVTSTAKRLLREIASLTTRFHGDSFEPPLSRSSKSLIPSDASQVLQFHCDGDSLMEDVKGSLEKVCRACDVESELIVERALQLLSSPFQVHRVSFAVLLHLAMDRADLAEDIVRNGSQSLMELCNSLSFSNDGAIHSRKSVSRTSSLYLRRMASNLSWQLELCLWIHRGGALPLSGHVLNEAIVAVRTGLLVASWNTDFECMETMLRQPPDCLVDHETGRQILTSLKIISSSSEGDKKAGVTSSGGWEFLVDCRRAEATELLRPRLTGCFIIRPHPDDHGVFTLSFKTNLVPTAEPTDEPDSKTVVPVSDAPDDSATADHKPAKSSTSRSVRKDDVVQHAIVRLSDSGFRCGSFGPFATLMKLLEAVSSSLPFDLRFDQPPTEGVIKEEGSKPSPNAAFFRKLALCQAENVSPRGPFAGLDGEDRKGEGAHEAVGSAGDESRSAATEKAVAKGKADAERRKRFGWFAELLVLSVVRKQLSCIAGAKYESYGTTWINGVDESKGDDISSVGSMSSSVDERGPEQNYAVAARILRPLLTWCRMVEIGILSELAPRLKDVSPRAAYLPVALNASETAIEISTTEASSGMDGGDAVIRRMIQPGSGVEFRTLRLGDGDESALVVLFSKKEAIGWFINSGVEKSEEDARERLKMMEQSRVIEPVDLKKLAPKAYRRVKLGESEDETDAGDVLGGCKGIRYRFVDPWEVEPLDSREAETRGASLGRHRFLAFSLGRVAASSEGIFRSIGGLHLLELWATARGGVALTKAIASVHPPWEQGAGGDLQLDDGAVVEPTAYVNSIRQHLYRNSLFRRLGLPQRFLALIQVELLDLKNLTSPGGSLSLSVYSLLRLKRSRSGPPLTVKARTLDSVATHPMKLGKSSGPNAPASWGSLVRFRFPLPEYTSTDGISFDGDREALFKGPPSVLQVSVYEKKFMSDSYLGGADVKLDGLSSGGQLEEWVPLKTETHGINWFARIRLTLRFELMCLSQENDKIEGFDELAPSVGLKRIQQLSKAGGAQEDLKHSVSTPDLLSYFESIVY